MYENKRMYKYQKGHFGIYHGRFMYRIINENDLWDLKYPVLRELTYAIRWITNDSSIMNKYFKLNPYIFYTEKFELWDFSGEHLLLLLEAIKRLIEFKAKLPII